MKRRFSRMLVVGVLVAGSALVGGPARADHRLVMITEVFLGTGGAAAAQFVELTTYSSGQNQVDNTSVKFYGTTGNQVELASFTSDVADAAASQSSILVATPDAETLFGVTSDLEFDAQELLNAGKVCFESPTFGKVDCVSWGDYTGEATGAGNPANPSEGIPVGASIVRDETRGSAGALDSADDTNNSNKDFDPASPRPEGGGVPSQVMQRIGFQDPTYVDDENATPAIVNIDREGATTGETKVVTFMARNGTAQDGPDYTHTDALVQFTTGDSTELKTVALVDNAQFEGPETVKLKVREPTATAVLGDKMNAVLTINDNEDDDEKPKSRITKPVHGKSYARGKITKFKGTASDGVGTVGEVAVALRRTMTDGSCQWKSGDLWIDGACSDKLLGKTSGDQENWRFPLGGKLQKSVGTDVKFYTAFSSAQDANGNTEDTFKQGRNANRFEVT